MNLSLFLKNLQLALVASAVVIPLCGHAADMPVKREMRSAWVATVWRLDWPSSVISSTGNTAQIDKQKSELTTMLDSMAVNNMNAVNFQVRSRSDAFYKSSYEPWSSDLVKTRGMDPGYDPLEFCVEECHKRGIECHAWVNPYRFESQQGQWSGMPGDYRSEHPDWVQDVNGAAILEPANPAVRQRICDIIREIVTNYDVDGVLFDDYFYIQGITDQDASWYKAYTDGGGQLSLADWRRENVNMMIADVYRTIKEVKPWVRFGVSPAGVACTSTEHARKYDVTPCPISSDWQYNGIYSDPLAWISRQTLDFISPQIYWTIGSSTDYKGVCEWWSGIASKWNRHFYSSHSISSLSLSSKAPGMAYASGPNSNTFAEFANEIRLNREFCTEGAPGSIFYSVKYMYKTAPKFAHYLRTTVFNTHALVPAMPWFVVSPSDVVSSVSISGDKLSWTGGPSNVRYTVYAVPNDVDHQNFTRQCEYLLGVSYSDQYSIPKEYKSGYSFAVCILDRYGNEYAPVFAGQQVGRLAAPVLKTPAEGETIEVPFDFVWSEPAGATHYIFEISDRQDMSNLLISTEVSASAVSSAEFSSMPLDTKLYWRVRACGTNAHEGVSSTGSFMAKVLTIDYPKDGAEDVAINTEIRWKNVNRDVTLELSSTDKFDEDDILYRATSGNGHIAAVNPGLAGYTTHYARLRYERNGLSWMSPTISFRTKEYIPQTPVITRPVASGTLYSDWKIAIAKMHGLKSFRIQVCAKDNFPSRQYYSQLCYPKDGFSDLKTGSEIRIVGKALADGQTYYVRVNGQYQTADGSFNTEYSPVIPFVYSSAVGAVTDITADGEKTFLSFNDNILTVNYSGNACINVSNIGGVTVAEVYNGPVNGNKTFALDSLLPGVYIVTLNNKDSLKILIK